MVLIKRRSLQDGCGPASMDRTRRAGRYRGFLPRFHMGPRARAEADFGLDLTA
jgi:hypothetical protein